MGKEVTVRLLKDNDEDMGALGAPWDFDVPNEVLESRGPI